MKQVNYKIPSLHRGVEWSRALKRVITSIHDFCRECPHRAVNYCHGYKDRTCGLKRKESPCELQWIFKDYEFKFNYEGKWERKK